MLAGGALVQQAFFQEIGFGLPQRGQRKPSGQRSAKRRLRQAFSVPKRRWKVMRSISV
jgi:hypothetical protein